MSVLKRQHIADKLTFRSLKDTEVEHAEATSEFDAATEELRSTQEALDSEVLCVRVCRSRRLY